MLQRDEEGFDLATAGPSATTTLRAVTELCGQAAGLLASRGHRQGNSAGLVKNCIHSQSHTQVHKHINFVDFLETK